MTDHDRLKHLLLAGSFLIGAKDSNSAHSSSNAAFDRLKKFYDYQERPCKVSAKTPTRELHLVTADEALDVVLQVQSIVGIPAEDESKIPPLGTRDIAHLRALLSLAFKWGTDTLLSHILGAISNSIKHTGPSKIVSVDNAEQDYTRISSMLDRLLKLLFPESPESRFPQTHITTSILSKNLLDVLKPTVALAWMPSSISIASIQPLTHLRPYVLRLLSLIPPSDAILALGGVISAFPSPAYIPRISSGLLTRQLLRPRGIRGLCITIFGEDEDSADTATDLNKMEHIAKVLTTVPKDMDPQGYCRTILLELVDLLVPVKPIVGDVPQSFKRAAAFALSCIVTGEETHTQKAILLALLHDPLHVASPNTTLLAPASRSLDILTTLLIHADPSPTLISTLVGPIVPALYALQEHLENVKTSDPTILESVRALLATWARITDTDECLGVLWSIVVSGQQDGWKTDFEGNLVRTAASAVNAQQRLELFTPQSRREAEEAGELDPNANVMDLYPDPARFVASLQRMGRAEVISEVFVRCLEGYRAAKVLTSDDDDPLKTLLFLQLIIQMQTQLKEGLLSLKNPSHILGFVKHVLVDAKKAEEEPETKHVKTGLDALRIVDGDEDEEVEDGDSDDEQSGSERYDEMIDTAVNLLLSILEANPDMSAKTVPILDEIFELLDHAPPSLRSLVREARMVMTIRIASAQETPERTRQPGEDTYQRALKLLQDPILPVRMHGLMLLRELRDPPEALVPAIVAIFMEAIRDDESYLYLSGVQGLAGMVDKHGKGILGRLVDEYIADLEGTIWDQATLDKRVRIGEALGIAIKRCGSALASYVDGIVPPLQRVLRSSGAPTALKTSAVSLLADCVGTYFLALGAYWEELVSSMLDLLQAETSTKEEEDPTKGMDANPTQRQRFPPMRRAALHFLGMLIRETTRAAYDGVAQLSFEPALLRRAKITLQYLAATEGDGIAKVMAREVTEAVTELEKAYVEYGTYRYK
ncbi:hypothetical protein CYLTODRAFT_406490 [Cylindrobasidium torrendii FP15055 ss-10]|uniref:Uncharacterized protein n=1 Tax=Cylindrobasidium torrendii FP15055 ss-10 TaxID=1314674 RepID=A0A0D7BTQ6_9AGAR|nr:hypothetical protein CYLTODRAFT_406490 [Cylindrobasidium torrendii FP15055 ss-10]